MRLIIETSIKSCFVLIVSSINFTLSFSLFSLSCSIFLSLVKQRSIQKEEEERLQPCFCWWCWTEAGDVKWGRRKSEKGNWVDSQLNVRKKKVRVKVEEGEGERGRERGRRRREGRKGSGYDFWPSLTVYCSSEKESFSLNFFPFEIQNLPVHWSLTHITFWGSKCILTAFKLQEAKQHVFSLPMQQQTRSIHSG